jgi:hypothetical protein
MYRYRFIVYLILFSLLNIFISFSQQDAKEIVEKSVKAYGGFNKLTQWKTMVLKGVIISDRSEAIKMKGALTRYTVKPDKLRIDQDFTAFEPNAEIRSYIYNNDQAWAIANLIPFYSNNYKPSMKAALDRVDGMAFYLKKSKSLLLLPEQIINNKPEHVIESITENDTTFLYIDKKTYFLVQDSLKNTKMLYSSFKKFDGIYYPTAYDQVVYTPQRMVVNKFKIDKVQYNVKIDPKLFEEEKQKK